MKESKAMVAKEMAFMKKKGAPKAMVKHEAKEMKAGGCTKMMKGGAVKAKNANQLGGDLPGSKHHGRTTGEGVEKGYKANTKAVKHGRDGIAQHGLTKVRRSKEM